jgi:hypothetical protein
MANGFTIDKDTISKKCLKYKQIRQFVTRFMVRDMEELKIDEIQSQVASLLSDDFFGHLSKVPTGSRKLATFEIYRYFYRFSFEKVMEFLNRKDFILITLRYMEQTQLGSFQKKKVFLQTHPNTFRALENILNLSIHRVFIKNSLESDQILDRKWTFSEDGKIEIPDGQHQF